MIDWFTPLAGVAGTLIATIIREVIGWYRARQKLVTAAELEFHEVLSSDSLRRLGDYLDRAVGQFSVAEYAHNSQVRRRVNMFLARVEDFVGTTEEIETPHSPIQIPRRYPAEGRSADGELKTVEERVLSGGVWDGLAHLRRLIEQRLRGLAFQRGLKVPQRPGATRLIDILRRNEIGNDDIWEPLRYSITICNRAVHGLDVSTAEAIEAITLARQALSALGLTQPT